MLRFALVALCLFMLAAVGVAATGKNVAYRSPHQDERSATTGGPQLRSPFRKAAICRAGEKQCRMASYITWCCQSDQQCDYSDVGGCR